MFRQALLLIGERSSPWFSPAISPPDEILDQLQERRGDLSQPEGYGEPEVAADSAVLNVVASGVAERAIARRGHAKERLDGWEAFRLPSPLCGASTAPQTNT